MYCDYEAVHADRKERRLRLNQVEEDDSECSNDSDIIIRPTFVVGFSSDSETECIADSVVKQSVSKEMLGNSASSPANNTTIRQLLELRHNGSSAPSSRSLNMQPIVVLEDCLKNVCGLFSNEFT